MGGICSNCIKNNKNYGANPSKFILSLIYLKKKTF